MSSINTLSAKDRKALAESEKDENRMYASLNYFKSPEGVAEYEKLGLKYPRTMMDEWYEKFLKLTRATKKEDYKQYIGQVKRYILANGQEYIIHDLTETRYDGLHNRKRFYRGGIGMYAIPVPHKEIKARVTEEEGFEQQIVTTVEGIDTGYSIPFNQKNIDKLLSYTDGNTQYSIEKQDYKSGMTLSISSFEDWSKGTYTELLRFGHIASDYEKQIMEDEKQGKFTHMGIPPAGGAGLYK